MADTETILRFGLFPVIIGIISALIGFMITWINDHLHKKRDNRETQMAKASEVQRRIIQSCDKLYNIMRHEAWYAAWRKALRDEPSDEDDEAWKRYKDALREWRTSSICNETELEAYFGCGNLEVKLFADINSLIESAALELWNVYHSPKKGGILLSKPGGFDALAARRDRNLSEEDTLKSRADFDVIFEGLRKKISLLSSVTTASIQSGYVGNLIGDRPPPKSVMDMMKSGESSVGDGYLLM